jgi:hypothetical protein
MPQGDIRGKQQRLSGHRYVHVFDFAAGFYAISIDPGSQPYITFFIEGKGYFKYLRLPFGVTGGPSEFGQLTAERLCDIVGNNTIELFVDDGGASANTFKEGMTKLRTLLERVRQEQLSLSASKLRVFMTEAVFAGATVGPDGVKPDTAKLTAIVNWPQPQDVSHLEGFLGLSGYFRDLVKGYAKLEKPLRDILHAVDTPKGIGKQAYQRIMRNYKLDSVWTAEHDKMFLEIKQRLVSEPVLQAPVFDGTPFIVTTDGSKDAFAGVLSQCITTTLPGGKKVTRLHPLGYASKRTSTSEEKYKPYLLEFAALKFSLDKFSDIVWGFPVKLETDCQALRDVLLNDTLHATHARWRDGVLAYDIMDVQHVPGTSNIADGISRQYEGTPKECGDGSEWDVCPDPDALAGVVQNLFQVEIPTEHLELRTRFANEPMFVHIIDALLEMDHGTRIRDRKRARHNAVNYQIDEGKLWFIGGGSKVRARPRRECVTKREAVELAKKEHENGGHWHRDSIKLALMDKIHSPALDSSIVTAILDCARCKNFGGTHLHALLNPITRRHPFELLVGDYLTLPEGKGGFHQVGLYLDTCTQHVWGYMFKTHGSGKTTLKSLKDIFFNFTAPETFMTDGGTHFTSHEVTEFCDTAGTRTHVVPAYSPWINGLVEGTNKLLIYILARLCAPELGEDGWREMDINNLPRNWPDHFMNAINLLNRRLLPSLKFSPKELMLGLVVNTPKTSLEVSTSPITPEDIETHMAYVAQQRTDVHSEAVRHADRRKEAFDQKVSRSKAGPVCFHIGQLVQVFRSDLAYLIGSDRKLTPMWSTPRRVVRRLANSYRLETLDGTELKGEFSARRLREFVPREGTDLAEAQKEHMKRVVKEEGERRKKEEEEVNNLRKTEGERAAEVEYKWADIIGPDFVYEEDEKIAEEEEEEEDEGIAARVVRRRGRRH